MDAADFSIATSSDGQVGMAVTAYKIGPVLADTIQSLLAQKNVNIAGLVLVVDGCDYAKSTHEICNRYARAYPGLFHAIWLDNGGVARARNQAVRWLIERYPDVEGIFLLDGDDLLTPNSAASSLDYLKRAKKTMEDRTPGWVYCDQVQFGHQRKALKYPSKFRSSRWLGSNLSQPSCLISREMFDAGIYWDEEMRQGNEDWEYWYTAMSHGFAGVHNPVAYLKYRRLTGNRSSLNRAKDALSKGQMRRKHAALMTPSRFCADEQENFPRWALLEPDCRWRLTTDPTLPGRLVDHGNFIDSVNYRFAHNRGTAYIADPYFPNLVASIDPVDLALLRRAGLLRDIFYEAEMALQDEALCLLDVRVAADSPVPHADVISVEADTVEVSTNTDTASSFMLSVWHVRDQFLSGPAETADEASIQSTVLGKVRRIVVTLPSTAPQRSGSTRPGTSSRRRITDLVEMTLDALNRPTSPSKLSRPDHQHCGQDKDSHRGLGTELFGLWPIRPQIKETGKADIALVIPTGATRAFTSCCAELSNLAATRDIALHVFSLGHTVTSNFGRIEPLVHSRIALNLDPLAWSPKSPQSYFGVPLYERVAQHHQDELVGRLCGMDAVMNFAGPIVGGPMMRLRKFGIETLLSYDAEADPENFETLYSQDGLPPPPADAQAASAFASAYRYIVAFDERSSHLLECACVPRAIITERFAEAIINVLYEDSRDIRVG